MSFANNVVSNAGRSLIAAATAADKITFVEFVASETAYTSAQLESAIPTDFEITGGFIRNAAVSGTEARITGSMQNQASVKTVKSFAILARLQSQSAGSEVVLAAVSDSTANIRIPSTSEPPVLITVPITITTAESGTVYVAAGSVPSMIDLENFVTLHNPIDPSVGQTQYIMGDKHFQSDLYADADVHCAADAYVSGAVGAYLVDASVYNVKSTVYGNSSKSYPNPQLRVRGQENSGGITGASVEFYKNTDSNGYVYSFIEMGCECENQVDNPIVALYPRYQSGYDSLPSKLNLSDVDQVIPGTASSTDIGSSSLPFKDIYADNFKGDLQGRIPRPSYTSGSVQNFPVGAIFLEYKLYTGQVEVGDTWTITSPSIDDRVAKCQSSSWSHSSKEVGLGTYMALSESEVVPNGGAAVILVMRIS